MMAIRRICCVSAFLVLIAAGASLSTAAAAELSLRVEGPDQTLFEGGVSTDSSLLNGLDGTGSHACGGEVSSGAALEASGLAWGGRWNADFQDFFVDSVAGHASNPADLAYWSILVDWRYALGMCRSVAHQGSEILFAYGGGPSPKILRLYGPAKAAIGDTVTVTVRDGWIRAGTGNDGGPVAGASVGGAITDSGGHAQLRLDKAGLQHLKATLPGAIRSDALDVCVGDDPCDGALPPDEDPPDESGPLLRYPAPGERYAFRASTRLLAGSADRARPVRHKGPSGRRCTRLTSRGGQKARACRKHAVAIAVTPAEGKWSLRLKRPLPAGKYHLTVRSGSEIAHRRFAVAARPRGIRGAHRRQIRWLGRVQLEDGSFGMDPRGASSPLATDWAAIALGRSAPRSVAFRKVLKPVRSEPRRDLSSLIRAALALGPSKRSSDRSRLRSYRRRIVRLQDPEGSWAGQVGLTAYALVALRGAEHKQARSRARRWLLAQPLAADADTIGAVLWAVGGSPVGKPAAIALRALQNEDGGFSSQPGGLANAQSTALAVIGLRSAGLRPRHLKAESGISPVDYLRARQRSGGRVDYQLGQSQSSVWVTAQSLLALARLQARSRRISRATAVREAAIAYSWAGGSRPVPHEAVSRQRSRAAGT